MIFINNFAAYNQNSYGACAYGSECSVVVGSGQGGAAGVPNTGVLFEPQILFPLIIGLSLLFALAVQIVRQVRRQNIVRKIGSST